VRIDGAPAKTQAELAKLASFLWLTPQMDRLFTEGASARRRFLDRLVLGFDPEHANALSAYERAMRERLHLLREGPADASWLTALEETMAAQGVAIAAARRDAALRIDQACTANVGPFPQARLAMAGEVEAALGSMPALAAEDTLRQRLAEQRRIDAEAGVTTYGPHRSDLLVEHVGNGMPAPQCSTGEQKALLLAILLAQARLLAAARGAAPLLLLDEVAAHLDPRRRTALFERLSAGGGQVLMTGTDRELFAGLGAGAIHTVAGGRIDPREAG